LPALHYFGEAVEDFADTAALVALCDVVICVDTAAAHLAGAMGKVVWLLLPYVPDWRWLLERADSPWYPSMRLFRQRRSGEWGPVLEDVSAALHGLASAAGAQ
jgi:ADP-heptose:LPS heptosyltransferase